MVAAGLNAHAPGVVNRFTDVGGLTAAARSNKTVQHLGVKVLVSAEIIRLRLDAD